jgi:ankyrin repeat protein
MYNIFIYPFFYLSIFIIYTYKNTKYIINIYKSKPLYLYLGETSLMLAARNGKTDVVKILLEKGADIHAKNNYG